MEARHTNAAREALLTANDLSADMAREHLANAMRGGLDWADLYFQQRAFENWRLEDGIVKTGGYSQDGGVGLRAVCGETMAYASSDIIDKSALQYLAEVSRVAKTSGAAQATGKMPRAAGKTPPLYTAASPLAEGCDKDKIALLQLADKILRQDPRVENVIAAVAGSFETVLIVRPDGALAADYRPMTRLHLEAIMREGDKRERGQAAAGWRGGYEKYDDKLVSELCAQALQDGGDKLCAQAAPAGKMPVVLGNGWAGVLLHEAVGHGLEGDFNRKGQSAFSGRVGQKVAADGVTVVDAGNLQDRRGSLCCDDEGAPTGATTLIENGVLRGYMQDNANARLMKTTPTGNGRRESYAHPPMPRMTNTYMPGGKYKPEEIIASVKDGVYAADFNGGEVDIANGNFVFVASKARRIRNGKLAEALKGATIIGNGPDIMPKISMVGDDFALDPGIGSCGKNGQWVPVGVGQPTIKIDAITVGGAKV